MQSKFLGNFSFLIVLNLIIKPLWLFGIDLKVQNLVGAEAYGNYFALFNFAIIFGIFLDLGINQFHTRDTAQNAEGLGRNIFSRLLLKIFLGALYVLLASLFALLLKFDFEQISLLWILLLSQFLLSLVLFFRGTLGGLQEYKTDGLISALDKSIMIIVCALIIWGHAFGLEMTIWNFAIAQLCAYGFAALVAFAVLVKKSSTWKIDVSVDDWKNILKLSLPFALQVLMMSIYSRVDGVMLERMLPDGKMQAGIYAASYRLLDGINQFGILLGAMLLPLLSKMVSEKKKVGSLLALCARFSWVLGVLVGLAAWFFAEPIMSVLYTEATDEYFSVMKILLVSFLPISLIYICGPALLAVNKLKRINVVILCGMIFNIVSNYFLIPSNQALGAAWTTLFTQVFICTALCYSVQQFLDLKSQAFLVGRAFVFAVLASVVFYFAHQYLDNWLVAILTAGSAGLILSVLVGLLRFSDLRSNW